MTKAPIAVALDAPDLATMSTWAQQVSPHVQVLKVGLEVFLRDGHKSVHTVREVSDCDIFLDLKLHDIPATVGGAARSVASLTPKFLTVHASGGAEMIKAAADALPDTLITAVTILTSLDQAQLTAMGWAGNAQDLVVGLAQQSVTAGARAIVCSPQEVAAVRAAVPADIVLITPGVRPAGSDAGDQKRIATPEQALADGANLLVIGRPITGAANIGEAAATIAGSISTTGSTSN
ncbi:MAG: orotidine-5'-phosphate decarboxylase [Actinobacteria bacterium]|nr:orotidine-5'-phosphate decarboxylase [Actinomycetota bacterium]